MRNFIIPLFLCLITAFLSCSSSETNTPSPKKSGEHFPFDRAGLDAIKENLDKYPQIEELGYVFKDYEFLNNELIVFTKPKNVTFGTIVNWIDYKQKKYVSDDYFPKYYKEVIAKLKVDEAGFDQLYKKMKHHYIEGVINEPDRKILFLNKPMGTYKGFVHSKPGRKSMQNGIQINDITLRVVEEFEGNWFGFVYP